MMSSEKSSRLSLSSFALRPVVGSMISAGIISLPHTFATVRRTERVVYRCGTVQGRQVHLPASTRHVLIFIGVQTLLVSSANASAFEKFADSPHLQISQSAWVIDTRGKHVDSASVAAWKFVPWTKGPMKRRRL
jgi:hypothetical protein